MKQSGKDYRRVVIKIGSSLLCPDGINFDSKILEDITEGVTGLIKDGREVVIVSSGAIAMGIHFLGLKKRPMQLHLLQASSAIGQHELMNRYRGYLKKHRVNSAQILLTWDDFSDRRRYLNAKNTLLTLLSYGSLPIVNENDTVSTDEIKFGDNDRLSALVSKMISADILIILTDVKGLLDEDKNIVRIVDEITPQIKKFASPTSKKTCVGGMITKIEAAKIAVDSGIPCVIANGRRKDIILAVIKEPQRYGTLFVPKRGLSAKKHWIAFGTRPKGKVIVDNGAKIALKNKKSLLSVGVTAVQGAFECGDIVSILDRQNCEFARGKVNLSNKQLDKVKGRRSDKEVIHCDNMVIL